MTEIEIKEIVRQRLELCEKEVVPLIENELEPRIKQERTSYDRWVSENTGYRACRCFESKLEDLINFVDENKEMLDWDDRRGDLYCKILYLINNREDDEIYYIEEKENNK